MSRAAKSPTVLITGANRGLGLEFARQYAADGWHVIATCRAPKQARELATISGDIKIRQLDIGDPAAVRGLARKLKSEAIDILINNAGIYGPRDSTFGKVDFEAWHEAFQINVMAPMLIAEVLADHVARSKKRAIVTITSRMGSIALTDSGGGYIYRSSKAALNMAMKALAATLEPRGVVVALIHPGWVRTDMGGAGAHLSPAESIASMRRVIDGLGPKDSGRFFNYDGSELPW